MTDAEILALYDQEQRIEPTFPGARREVVGNVIRIMDETPGSGMNFIIYSSLTAEEADAAIREQVDYFRANGRAFEWKLYDHDTPPDLRHRLAAHGFEVGEVEAIMALDLHHAPTALLQPITADVRRLTDPAGVDVIVGIEEAVWGRDRTQWGEHLAADMRRDPDLISVYVVYAADGTPACAAWLDFTPNSQFASLWGGATRLQYRKQGLYTAVLATRVQEAIQRGYRYLTIDASPMSRPIVAKHGFRFLTHSYPCTWQPGS